MLTKAIFDSLGSALERHGYGVEKFDSKNSDIMDIWHKNRSFGFIEITFCQAQEGYVIACPVDYDSPEDGLIEIFNNDVTPLVNQLDDFFAKCG